VLNHVPGLVTENPHALRHSSAFHIDDHLSLKPRQTGMRQIKRDRDTGRIVGAEPFARNPGMGPYAKVALCELIIKVVEAPLKPGALDRDLEVLEP
jgi:hypothetical protein